jgi:hypothetical protein
MNNKRKMKKKKTAWWFLRKLAMELPYDPTIPFLGT